MSWSARVAEEYKGVEDLEQVQDLILTSYAKIEQQVKNIVISMYLSLYKGRKIYTVSYDKIFSTYLTFILNIRQKRSMKIPWNWTTQGNVDYNSAWRNKTTATIFSW